MSTNSSSLSSRFLEKIFPIFFSSKVRQLDNIPGPKPIFPVGNILDFFGNDIHKLLYNYALEYGDLMCFWLGGRPNLLINDPALIEQVLVTHRDDFYKNSPQKVAKPIMGGSLILSNGKDWEFKRKNHPFSAAGIETYFQKIIPVVRKTTREHLETLAKSYADKSVDLFDELTQLLFRIFGLTILGAEMDADLFSYYMNLLNEINSRLQQPFPLSLSPKFWSDRRKWFDFIDNRIRDRQSHSDEEAIDLLAYITSRNTSELSMEQLRDELSTSFTAGTRNVAIVVASVLYLCSRYPQTKQKLQSEIKEFVAKHGNNFELADINKLSYLDKVIKESLRLYPAVPLFIREVLPGKSVVLGGHSLPEKTQIFCCSWAFHRNPNHWENPDLFDPERFTTEPLPFHYFPFGGGPRACVGMYYTLTCTKILLITILAEYFVDVDPSCNFETKAFAATIVPRDGLPAKIKRAL
ncbi:cytochrome P450 [Nostoc linckia]|uniref:cytochrome P450 n=1 Tax=Nostoc linckia TaxID=92942 RepID=UPI000BFF9F29|nr:cytochrome P450 [Nostoc linckia]